MNWYKYIQSQYDSDANLQKAEQYFSIGHGDFSDEFGEEPVFYVWAYLGGVDSYGPYVPRDRLEYDSEAQQKVEDGEWYEDDGTHGMIWGHETTDKTYKGRYEPETGRISIVVPDRMKFRDIPTKVMNDLMTHFDNIKDVQVF